MYIYTIYIYNTYIYIYVHIYIHTYIYMHTYIGPVKGDCICEDTAVYQSFCGVPLSQSRLYCIFTEET